MYTKRGLEVTTDSPDVIACIDQFHQQILGSGLDAGLILQGVKSHPDNSLLLCYAAAYYLYAQENEATRIAKNYLSAAKAHLKSANTRERLIYDAVMSWADRNYKQAISSLENIIKLYPRDTLAMKFLEWIFYCTGQAFQAEHFLQVCTMCAPENQDESHFLAIHSFALELCGHYEQAKDMAEAAIEMDLVTPWAHHTLAHVALLTHDIEGGIKRLNSLRSSWNNILPLLKGHNTWHLSLFHIANRNESEVMSLYPEISGAMPDTVLEQLDTVSLLWRMDMAGLPQNELLHQVAEHLGKHPEEYYTGFNNAHFIYCLVKAGHRKLAEGSLKKMEQYAHSVGTDTLWSDVILPLCQGIYFFADADYKRAYTLMAPVIDKSPQLGGSDAQVELFAQTYFQTLLHSKQQDKAQDFFSQHLSHYRNTPLGDWWLMAND